MRAEKEVFATSMKGLINVCRLHLIFSLCWYLTSDTEMSVSRL